MPDIPPYKVYRDGQPITRTGLSGTTRQLERLGRDVAGNYRPPQRPGVVGQQFGPAAADTWIGIVGSAGPSGQADYSDARYWVYRAIPRQTLANGDLFDTSVETIPNVAETVTATNLAELPPGPDPATVTHGGTTVGGTHTLAVGTRVIVERFRTRETNGAAGVDQFQFTSGGSSLPVGQYQYQLYGMVSTNQTGFTYALAHAMTPIYNGSSGS
jgi:hypothetical protein